MNLPLIKQKLIEKIQSTNDEVLIVELFDMVEQHDIVVPLSQAQNHILKERIKKVEEGKGVFYNAKEEAKR